MRTFQKSLSILGACLSLLSQPEAKGQEQPAGGQSTSQVSSNTGRRRYSLLNFAFDYRKSAAIADERPLALSNAGQMQLSEYRFTATGTLLAQRSQAVRLSASIPIRQLSSTAPLSSQGSEIGGYEAAVELSFAESLKLRAGFADRRSSLLELHDNHAEIFASMGLNSRSPLAGRLFLNMSGQMAWLRAQGGKLGTSPVLYGPAYEFQGGLGIEALFSRDAHFRVGSEIYFRRQTSYRLGPNDLGEVGLLTLSPSLEYRLLDDFWVGLFVESPLARPAGKEFQFGNPSLPGLYGRVAGLKFSATTF